MGKAVSVVAAAEKWGGRDGRPKADGKFARMISTSPRKTDSGKKWLAGYMREFWGMRFAVGSGYMRLEVRAGRAANW